MFHYLLALLRAFRTARLRFGELGQSTAEYALVILGAVATRMGASLQRPPGRLGRAIAPAWPWFLAGALLGYLGLMPGILLAGTWGVASEALVMGLAAFAFANLGLAVFLRGCFLVKSHHAVVMPFLLQGSHFVQTQPDTPIACPHAPTAAPAGLAEANARGAGGVWRRGPNGGGGGWGSSSPPRKPSSGVGALAPERATSPAKAVEATAVEQPVGEGPWNRQDHRHRDPDVGDSGSQSRCGSVEMV